MGIAEGVVFCEPVSLGVAEFRFSVWGVNHHIADVRKSLWRFAALEPRAWDGHDTMMISERSFHRKKRFL